ncbi:MAG: tetratricopeptide repeat protein [Alphaproteobacteria bacterium]
MSRKVTVAKIFVAVCASIVVGVFSVRFFYTAASCIQLDKFHIHPDGRKDCQKELGCKAYAHGWCGNMEYAWKSRSELESDEAKVFALMRLAEAGDSSAQLSLGHLYSPYTAKPKHGYIVQRDCKEALKWYRKAAEQGDLSSQLNLYKIYEHGTCVFRNPEEAYFWAAIASMQNSPIRSKALKMAQLLTPDKKAALDERVAEWKSIPSHMPDSVKTQNQAWADKEKQDNGLLDRGEKGDLTAARDISHFYQSGHFYENGAFRLPDQAKAAKWLRVSAENGDFMGAWHLGRRYQNGNGVEKDEVEALYWFVVAAQGYGHGVNDDSVMLVKTSGPEVVIAAQKKLREKNPNDQLLEMVLEHAFNRAEGAPPHQDVWTVDYLCKTYPGLCAKRPAGQFPGWGKL